MELFPPDKYYYPRCRTKNAKMYYTNKFSFMTTVLQPYILQSSVIHNGANFTNHHCESSRMDQRIYRMTRLLNWASITTSIKITLGTQYDRAPPINGILYVFVLSSYGVQSSDTPPMTTILFFMCRIVMKMYFFWL